jgi:hypothetical protein
MTISAGSTILATDFVPKGGTTTKDISNTTATTIAHGLGHAPRVVRLQAMNVHDDMYISIAHGNYTSSGWKAISIAMRTNTGSTNQISTAFRLYNNSVSEYVEGTVTVDATNITITWTRTGGPAGTVNILWEAE